jgi:transcription elongation GreA/GreB family factor
MIVPNTRLDVSSWWMTSDAWSALHVELARLDAEVTTGRSERGGASVLDPVRRHRLLSAVRDAAVVDDAPGRVAIGRGVTLADDAGDATTYTVVLPGEGNPARGAISADSPLGIALLGAREGSTVEVTAPSGRWTARVLAVA